MRRFWKRRGEAELESRLERRRQPATPDFVNQLAREVRSTGRRRLVPSRLLLAAALTLMMLVAVASVGGVASGASVRDQLVAAVKSVNKQVTAQRVSSSFALADDDDGDDDGDDDQYEEDERECRTALEQAHAIFHQGQFTFAAHRLYHQLLREAREECSEIDD